MRRRGRGGYALMEEDGGADKREGLRKEYAQDEEKNDAE